MFIQMYRIARESFAGRRRLFQKVFRPELNHCCLISVFCLLALAGSGCLTIGVLDHDDDLEILRVKEEHFYRSSRITYAQMDVDVSFKRYFFSATSLLTFIPIADRTTRATLIFQDKPSAKSQDFAPVIVKLPNGKIWEYTASTIIVAPRREKAAEGFAMLHTCSENPFPYAIIRVPETFPFPDSGKLPNAFIVEKKVFMPYKWEGDELFCLKLNLENRYFWNGALDEDGIPTKTMRFLCVPACVVIDIPVTIAGLTFYVSATILTLPFLVFLYDYPDDRDDFYVPSSEQEVCPKCGRRLEPSGSG